MDVAQQSFGFCHHSLSAGRSLTGMALAPPVAGSLADTHTTQKVTSHLGHHVHSHGTVRSQAAHQCKLEHQLGRSSRATWGSSASFSRQRHNPRQKRGHSAIVYADQDYYSVLGISKNADKQAIKSAYRQKARKFHPDVNKEPGAEDTFKSISNAYEVLSDEQKRGIYDRQAAPFYSRIVLSDSLWQQMERISQTSMYAWLDRFLLLHLLQGL